MSAQQTQGAGAPGRVVLAAGGTGGHMFPAQALASELSRRGFLPILITDERGGGYEEAPAASRPTVSAPARSPVSARLPAFPGC